ncbi:MAG TPA: porin [Terriglobales bacterium]|nr:porin [Terriglobales bacterium]
MKSLCSVTLSRMLALFLVVFLDAVAPAESTVFGGDSGGGAAVAASTSHPSCLRADGLTFTSESTSTQLRIHGYLQGDGHFFSSDPKGQSPDKLLFRRIRPQFEGTLFKVLDFRFMPDFGQNNPQVQDIHVELNVFSFARPRFGKFKAPISLEALRSDSEATFPERSLASNLVPLREVGAQLGGSVLRGAVSYAAGFFNSANDGSNGNFQWRPGNEAAARVFFQPFLRSNAAPLRGLGVGLAGSSGAQGGTLPRLKTAGQNTFFRYSSTAVADGQHNRLSPQAYYYRGSLGIMGEYNISSQQVRSGTNRRRLNHQAWQASASFMLTGEKNSYAGVRPLRAFEPQKGLRHLGGWEIAARYSHIRIDRSAFPVFADSKTAAAAAAELGVALNWYVNRFTRLMNAYEHTSFQAAPSSAAPLRGEHVVMSRIQFSF